MADGYLGIARARLGPSAALITSNRGAAACEENRLTRARQASTAGLPELAIPELLAYQQISEQEVIRIGAVRDENQPDWYGDVRHFAGALDVIDADRAHAEYAFAASGFDSAIVIVCGGPPSVAGWTAWRASRGTALTPYTEHVGDFPIARIYSAMTNALGFRGSRDEHLVEAMARAGDASQSDAGSALRLTDRGLSIAADFEQSMHGLAAESDSDITRRHIAASVQQALGASLVELLRRLARSSGAKRVCLSGGLFFNTHFTTAAAHCNEFEETFIPPHPGRSGSAMGAALAVRGAGAVDVAVSSPYLGPGYDDMQVKEALENCKLSFDLQREGAVIETVLRALQRGRLVGWFHGRLEWGPRALGHRTVLADPFNAHVLENLNGYLKKRPWYRSYGVSVPAARLNELFEVPPGCGNRPVSASPFMQFEYRPRDRERFRTILPPGVQTLRVHTVDASEPRYLRLLEAWGAQAGMPVLVNTSFNGFHEPLVCSPRDAIRVFYGTGLDLMALEDFVLRK